MTAARRLLTGRLQVALPPAEAFRLFTPRGEVDWAPGWQPQFPGPVGDDAAPGTVFETDAHGHRTVWVVTSSQRGRHISYAGTRTFAVPQLPKEGTVASSASAQSRSRWARITAATAAGLAGLALAGPALASSAAPAAAGPAGWHQLRSRVMLNGAKLSHGDKEQIFVRRGAGGLGARLAVLRLSQSVDDTAWVRSRAGRLLRLTPAATPSTWSPAGSGLLPCWSR